MREQREATGNVRYMRKEKKMKEDHRRSDTTTECKGLL